jgi:hypothetical protein
LAAAAPVVVVWSHDAAADHVIVVHLPGTFRPLVLLPSRSQYIENYMWEGLAVICVEEGEARERRALVGQSLWDELDTGVIGVAGARRELG